MTITTKYSATCQACAKSLKPGDHINWTRGLKAVTCAGCPMPVSDEQAALAKDGQALRARIGELTQQLIETAKILATTTTERDAAKRDANTERMAHVTTQNVLGHVQTERNEATAKCRELQTMLDGMHRLAVSHYSAIEIGAALDSAFDASEATAAHAAPEIDVLAPGGVERWLEADAETRAANSKRQEIPIIETTRTERTGAIDTNNDDCPI